MSRQLEAASEERERRRVEALIKALEFGINNAISNQGAALKGIAIRYSEFDCLLTIKADFNGTRHIAFIGSDSMMNCLIKCDRAAVENNLRWKKDKYHNGQS